MDSGVQGSAALMEWWIMVVCRHGTHSVERTIVQPLIGCSWFMTVTRRAEVWSEGAVQKRHLLSCGFSSHVDMVYMCSSSPRCSSWMIWIFDARPSFYRSRATTGVHSFSFHLYFDGWIEEIREKSLSLSSKMRDKQRHSLLRPEVQGNVNNNNHAA